MVFDLTNLILVGLVMELSNQTGKFWLWHGETVGVCHQVEILLQQNFEKNPPLMNLSYQREEQESCK